MVHTGLKTAFIVLVFPKDLEIDSLSSNVLLCILKIMFESIEKAEAKRPASLVFEPIMSDTDSLKSESIKSWETWQPALDLLEAADRFISWNATQKKSLLERSSISEWNFKQAFTTVEEIPDSSPNSLPVTIPHHFSHPSTPSSTHAAPGTPPPQSSPIRKSSSGNVSRRSWNTPASPTSPPPDVSLSKQSSFGNERRFNECILGDNNRSSDGSVRSSKSSHSPPNYNSSRTSISESSPTSPKSTTYTSPHVSESYLFPDVVPPEIIILYHTAHRVAKQGIGTTQKLTPEIASSLADRALQQANIAANFRPPPELEILLSRIFSLLADKLGDNNAPKTPDSAKNFAARSDESIKYGYLDTDGRVRRLRKRVIREWREIRAWLQLLLAFVILLPLFWEVFTKMFPRQEAFRIEMD